ncbi:hypothetical protein BX666DRAFT_814295 [Dichotomocladium elegans]|nr:hypothetical protein BX666DRAFT_814295 [Dichotomocladium elegans]
MQSFEFTATCEQEKQIWLDALQNAIQSSKADNAQCKTPANAMEELFVSSIGMQSSSPCVPLQGSSSSISLFSSLTQNECFQSTDTPRTGFSADSADTGSHAYGSVHSSLSSTSTGSSASSHVNASLQSPGLRSQASFSDFCDFVSSTMADIRSQRRYQQNSLRCTNVDNKFEDVCTTPILTARSQMRADRTSGIDQWKRKSRMGKSTSMLVFNSDVDDESKQHHYTLVSPWNKTVVNRSAHGETVRGGMYRKSSLPSRLRMAEPAKAEDRHTPSMFSRSPLAEKSALRQQQPWCQLPPQPQQPPLCPLPLPSSPRHAATTIGAESMILKLSRRGSTQGNCHVQQQKDHNLHHTPGLPRSLSAATMGFARTSSRLLGRVVEKLGTIGTPGSARRYTSSGFQPSGRVPQTSTRPDEVIVDTRVWVKRD